MFICTINKINTKYISQILTILFLKNKNKLNLNVTNLTKLSNHQTPTILLSLYLLNNKNYKYNHTTPKFISINPKKSNSKTPSYKKNILYKTIFPILKFLHNYIKKT